MRNAGLDELQAGIKIGRETTTSDTWMIPLYGRNQRELKNFLMRVKEESERAGLKPNI